MSWVTVIAALLTKAFEYFIGRSKERSVNQNRQDGANELEVQAHRKANDVSDAATTAAGSVVHTPDAASTDPNNRRR